MLNEVKAALRLTTNAHDDELTILINAAYKDLGLAGTIIPTETVVTTSGDETAVTDPLIIRAVTTYCKFSFGQPADGEFDRLKAAYDEQKAQLSMATGYTNWGDSE